MLEWVPRPHCLLHKTLLDSFKLVLLWEKGNWILTKKRPGKKDQKMKRIQGSCLLPRESVYQKWAHSANIKAIFFFLLIKFLNFVPLCTSKILRINLAKVVWLLQFLAPTNLCFLIHQSIRSFVYVF